MAAFRCLARALLRRPLAANSMTTYKRNNVRGFLVPYSLSGFRCHRPEDGIVCRQPPLISLRIVLKLKGSAQHLSNETTNEPQSKGHMVTVCHWRLFICAVGDQILMLLSWGQYNCNAGHKWRQAWTLSPQFNNRRRLAFLAR